MILPFTREEAITLLALDEELGRLILDEPGSLADAFYRETGRAEDEAWLIGSLIKIKMGYYDHLLSPVRCTEVEGLYLETVQA